MTNWHLNIRGSDKRGDFTIQTKCEAPTALEALDKVLNSWNVDHANLWRIHIGSVEKDSKGET